MFSLFYNTIIFNPLYNGLIYLMDIFPWMDAGIAVIIFTVIVRLILFPLSKKAVVTQIRMKELQPELKAIQEKYKSDKQTQSLQTMALYKAKGVSPFASFLFLFIQIPIIYALYSIFVRSGLPVVNTSLLYSFVHTPAVNMHFLGILDIGMPSIILSLVAAIAQFLQLHYSLAANSPITNSKDTMDMAQNMTKNMKYVFPVVIFLISYRISAVVALYWTVTSLFTLGQELVVKRHLKQHKPL